MELKQAQKNMSEAYVGGGPGVLISALVWLAAGVVAYQYSMWPGMLTLFFGGMLIHPVSVIMVKRLKGTGRHSKDNPLGLFVVENLFILFVGIFVAFYLAQYNTNWFFPLMLMTIGLRYVGFQSIYGNKLYWLLAAILALMGAASLLLDVEPWQVALGGGSVELVIAMLLLYQSKTISELNCR